MNLNKVFILGRLTADPQLRTTPGGESVATFSLATNRFWTDRAGGKKETTEYHNIVVWGRQAEFVSQYLSKGGMALVEGRLQTRSWEAKEGGTRKTTEIVAENIQLGPRPSGTTGGAPRTEGAYQGAGGHGRMEPRGKGREERAPEKEEMPVIDLDEEGIRPEDLPF